MCMVCGSCAGSTSGGVKCIRIAMLFRIIRNEFKHILHPRAVIPVRLNNTNIPYQSQATLLVFFALYGISCMAAFFCFGRLEFFSVLVLFTRAFWKKN